MSQPNYEGIDDLSKNSQIYYDLINSKEYFKNIKGKATGPKGRVQMFSPGTASDDSSQPTTNMVIELVEEAVPVVVPTSNWKCSESEIEIKENMLVHIGGYEEFFSQGQFSDFFTDKPPGKLDERNSKKPDKVALFAKLCEYHNYGNKSIHACIMFKAFESARSSETDSLSDVKGIFETVTIYAKLLYQLLCDLVPSWKCKVDKLLLFKKMKSALTYFRSNFKKSK